LYIDVGGGSTELTLFVRNKVVASQSFNIGTIRLLHDQVAKETWNDFKDWVKEKTKLHYPLTAIGSGGNINKLFKMADKKENKPLTLNKIQESYYFLKEFSVEQRITVLGLNPDRADVIVPATKIFITVMKTAGIDKIIVPQIGLSDGIIHLLYENHKNNRRCFDSSVGVNDLFVGASIIMGGAGRALIIIGGAGRDLPLPLRTCPSQYITATTIIYRRNHGNGRSRPAPPNTCLPLPIYTCLHHLHLHQWMNKIFMACADFVTFKIFAQLFPFYKMLSVTDSELCVIGDFFQMYPSVLFLIVAL
jgi:hypothetical protein